MSVARLAQLVGATALAAAVVLTCRDSQEPRSPTDVARPLASTLPAGSVTFIGAGDVSSCTHHSDTLTAKLLDTIPGTVFVTGDNVGSPGDSTTYANCYNPTWGRQKTRTYPVPGDVEYTTAGAPGYFGYWGAAAGDPTKGYYSYTLGAWHVIALNSATSMAAGSAQEQWLKADLAANPAQCTLAYWHLPAFYSGTSTVRASVLPLWNDLYAAHADVVLNSHTRNYERFAPQTPAAVLDTVQGIREFIVGTGGLGTWSFYTIAPNSLVRGQIYGVLKFTLSPGSYFWKFIPIAGTQFADSGSAACHGAAAPTPGVNAGPDQTAHPGDTVKVSVAIADVASVAPWSYTLTWGDGASTSGSASASPIVASHVYAALGLDSVRVTVTNRLGGMGADTASVQLIPATTSVVFVGAGDIADCSNQGDTATAKLLDGIPGTVFAAGDNAYPYGASTDYTTCYDPTWGRHKSRTRPVPGNHDYSTAGAAGYFGYFGAAAGDPSKGYYSFDLGNWHIVALNSNIATNAGSPQEQWLVADLAASGKQCTLAFWHHPMFSSGLEGPDSMVKPLYQDLYNAGAEVVIVGHDHDYERFAPQTAAGALDNVYGVREFVVGTGGAGLFSWGPTILPNSQARNNSDKGVLKLTLNATGYSWTFVPIAGKTYSDSGSTACHGSPSGGGSSPPQASAGGPYSGNEGAAVSFNGAGSSDPQGSTLSYAWTFGDGATGTGSSPTHVYADNGSYTVTLTVTDGLGLASAPSTTTASIANVAPTVILPGNQTATAGSPYSLSATFSDPGVNDSTWTYTIDWGDGSAPTTGSTKIQTTAITASHTYGAGGTDTVRVTVTDKDGGAGSAKTPLVVTAAPQPPTAAPGGPYAGAEGAAVSFDGSGSSDPQGDALTYAWTFGDGGTGTGAKPTHVYADNGAYTVTLTVTDAHTLSSSPATATATIANVAPVVTLPPNQVATAGSAYTLSATFSDVGVNDAPWAYTIDWGDGTAQTTGSATTQTTAITASHTYAAGGTDTVRVTVTDKDGGAGSAKTPVGVTAAPKPPTAVPGGPYAGAEGTAVSFSGSGSSDPQGDALTYAWTFGDGATGSGVKPTHVYADNGSYTVTLTVTDAHALSSAPATTTATIANVAPTVSVGASLSATAGAPLTLSATFADPGVNDAPWTYSINWGDGSAATTGSTSSQASALSAAHTYAAAGTFTGTVTVTDKDGGAGTGLTTITVAQQVTSVTLVGAGNIARCDRTNDEATAALLDAVPGTVFALGDNAYPNGTAANFTCYDASWGRHKTRTYPVPGNHEYDSSATAVNYFNYFGAVAGNPGQGYYSFDLGAWHVVVLNSNNAFVSTAVGSPQETWLKADLAASTKKCQVALFHHPRFYSTTSTAFYPTGSVKPFWDDLYAAGAELILNAHMQDYERFAPQTSSGAADPVNGIREIIVGTGGSGLDAPNTLIIPNSEARVSGVYGVLKLTLSDGSYSWQFIPVAGQTAADSGSGSCH